MPAFPNQAPRNARPAIEYDSSRIETRPGKFQGEPFYVASYWNDALDGSATTDLYSGGTLISAFVLTQDDYDLHPALKCVHTLAVWEDGAGFVHHACMTAEEYAAFVANCDACAEGDGND